MCVHRPSQVLTPTRILPQGYWNFTIDHIPKSTSKILSRLLSVMAHGEPGCGTEKSRFAADFRGVNASAEAHARVS